MREKKWAVTYTRNGNQQTLVMDWPERPPNEQAALRIWKEELPGPQVIPTSERGDSDHTVGQLRMKGIEIAGIEEVVD